MRAPILISVLLLGICSAGALAAGSASGGGSFTPAPTQSYNPQEEYKSGVAALKSEDWKGAVSHFRKVVDAVPKNADANNLLGYSLRRNGDRKGGLKYYKKALAINPNHLGANHYLGEFYLEAKDMAGAETQLATPMRISPTSAEAAALKASIDAVKAGQPYKAKLPMLTY